MKKWIAFFVFVILFSCVDKSKTTIVIENNNVNETTNQPGLDDFEPLSDDELSAINDDELYNEEWIEALLAFLKSPDSLSVDMEKEAPFMNISVSDDGRLRTYNWISNRDSNWHFDSIIQYDTGLGTLDAILVRDITSDYDYYLGKLDYGYPRRIKENIYLLGGHARAAPWVYAVGYITVTIEDGVLRPYLAFNNKMGMLYFDDHTKWEGYTNIGPFFDDDIDKFIVTEPAAEAAGRGSPPEPTAEASNLWFDNLWFD